MNQLINYTLPEFVFLDGNGHEGNSLEGRTVLQHILSATIMEVVDLSELKIHSFQKPTFEFDYTNKAGIVEKHILVLHFSVFFDIGAGSHDELENIFKLSAKWYCDYLAWEDGNIINDDKATHH